MSGPLTDLIPPPPSKTLGARPEPARARPAADTQATSLRAGSIPTQLARRRPRADGTRLSAPAELLLTLWPFCDLPRPVLWALIERMRSRRFAPGQAIIRQGERSRRLAMVAEGEVRVRVRAGRKSHEIARLGRGAVLGEMGLLTGAPCTATAVALTPVRAITISARRFRRLAVRYPVLSSSLGSLVATRLGQAPVDTLVGKVLRGYRVRRCVGRGGMGVVYEAAPLEGGRRVALKMMSHRFAFDLEVQQRFEREIEICRSLRHPNVGRVLEHFTAFGTSFMVMEFCDGPTLDEVLRAAGPLGEDRVRRIAGQLAGGLAYVHRHGVCHRDVKPSNVILTGRDHVKLVDFGLAKATTGGELTQQGCILGTPRYMPPEQLSGQPVDRRADLFALGSVVYEMLAGKAPFADESIAAILGRDCRWSLPPADEIRPGLSHDLYRFLEQTLAVNPSDRVADLQRISRAWRRPPLARVVHGCS